MKKTFILTMMAVLTIGGKGFAQSVKAYKVATLDHQGTLTVFYGDDALKEAHETADNGDLITLSPGRFNATNITKAITLHGAGMYSGTTINGNFIISLPDSVSKALTLEGLSMDVVSISGILKDAQFSKCYFYEFGNKPEGSNCTIDDLTILHCYFQYFWLNGIGIINNSVLASIEELQAHSYVFSNCYLNFNTTLSNSDLYNCFVNIYGNYWNGLTSTCSTVSCVTEYFEYVAMADNKTTPQVIYESDLFATRSNIPPYYTIKDEYKNTYVGYDSTEIGIYGGFYPFDPIPQYPQISKFNIDSQVKDGKLGVRVEVLGTKEEDE